MALGDSIEILDEHLKGLGVVAHQSSAELLMNQCEYNILALELDLIVKDVVELEGRSPFHLINLQYVTMSLQHEHV